MPIEVFFNQDVIREYLKNIDHSGKIYIHTKSVVMKNIEPILDYNFFDVYDHLGGYYKKYLISSLRYTPNTDYIVIGNVSESNDKYENLCGILIVQKGECLEFPEHWTVRFVSNISKSIKPFCQNYGTKLLGVYMAMLMHYRELNPDEYQSIGLLELADSYENLAGYCSYTKYGFTEEYFYTCSRFAPDNLFMTTHIDNFNLEDIYKIARENIRYNKGKKQKRNPLCIIKNKDFISEWIATLESLKEFDYDRPLEKSEVEKLHRVAIANNIIEQDLEKNKDINARRLARVKAGLMPANVIPSDTSSEGEFSDEELRLSPLAGESEKKSSHELAESKGEAIETGVMSYLTTSKKGRAMLDAVRKSGKSIDELIESVVKDSDYVQDDDDYEPDSMESLERRLSSIPVQRIVPLPDSGWKRRSAKRSKKKSKGRTPKKSKNKRRKSGTRSKRSSKRNIKNRH